MSSPTTASPDYVRHAVGTFVRQRFGSQVTEEQDLIPGGLLAERVRFARDVCAFVRVVFEIPITERDVLAARGHSISAVVDVIEQQRGAGADVRRVEA